jgi:hypothetical protein
MTIKVTKPKVKPKVNCSGCKAELTFEFDDLVVRYFDGDYIENGPPGVGVPCPECSTVTQWKQAPSALVDKTMAREKAAKTKESDK